MRDTNKLRDQVDKKLNWAYSDA